MQSATMHAESSPSTPLRTVAVIFFSCLVIMIALGTRLTVGLFVQPIMDTTGMSIALAIGQLSWGVFQPIFGAWADKGHAFSALAVGMFCIAAGQLVTLAANGFWTLTLAQGILSPGGVAAGSFAGVFAIAAARLPARIRTAAGGVINAGGSLGQFVYAPLIHLIMHLRDYYTSLIALAGLAVAAIAPAWALCRIKVLHEEEPASDSLGRESLREQLAVALRTPSYILLNAGFFTCGFHVAFLITHLPGEIALAGHSAAVSAASISLIGLCNIAGSVAVGFICRYVLMKNLLAWIYALRAVIIAIYLASPKTEASFYIFACAIGFTWLATVPPTAGIVNKLFGRRYLATLFGLAFFSHQVGGFLGAWFGGLAMEQSGNFLWVWHVDVALALFASAVNLPIKEQSGL